RYRLHAKDLPGKPDILMPGRKKAILIHGCFWHGHENCSRAKRPTSNEDFWNSKLDKNIIRDKQNLAELKGLGWDTVVIWQCEMKDLAALECRLVSFIEGKPAP